MGIQLQGIREHLRQFDFGKLFIEGLGWSKPPSRKAKSFEIKEQQFSQRQIAELAGVVVLEVTNEQGTIPDAKTRGAVHKGITKHYHENLLIFLDKDRTQSLWYWVKRQDGKTFPRSHLYVQGQPGDLFVSKLGQLVFDITEFDEDGKVGLVEVANRVRKAMDVERVTKKFFQEFQQQHIAFLELITGIKDERDRRWFASVLLNRLMFIYFLQQKTIIDNGDLNYLQNKLTSSKKNGTNRYFRDFLTPLFFEGFAKPKAKRSKETNDLLGDIQYLNGGLFLPHKVEEENPKINVPDKAFENLFALFQRYSWNLDDTPGGKADEINPDVLGYIFEKYINQKAFGAYYTRPEITDYLCEQTIHKLILDAINTPEDIRKNLPAGVKHRQYQSVGDLLLDLDAQLCKRLLHDVLPGLSLLDPACGSGAFLVAAMKTLIDIYSAVIGRIKFLSDRNLTRWLKKTEKEHASISYFIKKSIITNNLYGVDIMEEATEIAKLRLFLALVASAQTADQLEPLPNIDFNVMAGNSLIGLMRVDEGEFDKHGDQKVQKLMFRKTYRQVLEEKNRLIEIYRKSTTYTEDLTALRDNIDEKKREAYETLDDILREEFHALKIKFEQATWDDAKGKPGKTEKRSVSPEDIERLEPFHWAFEFDEILNQRGGFDAIIANPPWEIFKPNGKEFFEDYSDLVSKKKMSIHDFEKQKKTLLKDTEIRAAWLDYLSHFPYQSAYFRKSDQYKNQIGIVNGRKTGSDINLYKLFLERCYHLLRDGGECGIVIPSGIYTDLGTKQLREMLFTQTNMTGLFGFENRKAIFEGVHRSFKFVVLSFEKGGSTTSFPAAFMRHDVEELEAFPASGAIDMPIEMVRRLSPDSLSVMEFKSDLDIQIAEKMLRFPLLGEEIEGKWKLALFREFDMTNDSHLFKTKPGKGRLPLYEGKMIWQFDHQYAEPRYWVDEAAGQKRLLGKRGDRKRRLDYQEYRLGYRDIARNTDMRTMICTIIPPAFHGNKIPTVKVFDGDSNRYISSAEQLVLCAIWNSFVIDYCLRQRVSTTLNFFYLYQLPVPRLTEGDEFFEPILWRSGQLICTTPEFDDLAKEIGLKSHKQGVTNESKRIQLRAELDALVAQLYGLTEQEFAHILTTFPIVPDPVKVATQNAFRDAERGLIQ